MRAINICIIGKRHFADFLFHLFWINYVRNRLMLLKDMISKIFKKFSRIVIYLMGTGLRAIHSYKGHIWITTSASYNIMQLLIFITLENMRWKGDLPVKIYVIVYSHQLKLCIYVLIVFFNISFWVSIFWLG